MCQALCSNLQHSVVPANPVTVKENGCKLSGCTLKSVLDHRNSFLHHTHDAEILSIMR